jgi:hypothetical protein
LDFFFALINCHLQVVDFSDAQMLGFQQAFIDYFSAADFDSRTESELQVAVTKLLRGCEYHFRSGVATVARFGGIIHKDERRNFRKLVISLVDIRSQEEFQDTVDSILIKWPRIRPWLEWWLRPSHAAMLFSSQRTMSLDILAQVPKDTNAEESMHHTIYQVAGGKKFDLIPGLDGLLVVEKWFHLRFDHVLGLSKLTLSLTGYLLSTIFSWWKRWLWHVWDPISSTAVFQAWTDKSYPKSWTTQAQS